MWLGERHGYLIDWLTQKWVQVTGRRVSLQEDPWLEGPVGATHGIGLDFFDKWATAEGFAVERFTSEKGLLSRFTALSGPTFDADAVDPAIREFYERTADYDVDVWSEWRPAFKPFGYLVSVLFSRRLEQLNLPLSSLDTSWGMTSATLQVTEHASGSLKANAWVRTLVKSRRITYVGSYSIVEPRNFSGPCVKTVFPLPNGNAIVVLRPEVKPDGSLVLVSSGSGLGDPGFYFTVHRANGTVKARFLRCFREHIHVYSDGEGIVRADHTMSLWGFQCLHLHYRMRRK